MKIGALATLFAGGGFRMVDTDPKPRVGVTTLIPDTPRRDSTEKRIVMYMSHADRDRFDRMCTQIHESRQQVLRRLLFGEIETWEAKNR